MTEFGHLAARAGERSFFVGWVQSFNKPQTGRPVLSTVQKMAGIPELAVSIFASLLAWDQVVAFTRCQCRDLSLTCHFQPVMIDRAFGNASAADKDTVIAQDHEQATVEVAQQFWRHVVVELEAFERVV